MDEIQTPAPSPFANRLAEEASPYLRLHATNPVAWLPWGEEAFARARAEQKPIFLSVGYFTCHWCHVMERESFADAELAARLNRDFVAIKVDREERPEVDHLYMTYVQATTGGGGWPMSVFLTPELKPFFGGTYYPPRSRGGQPGFDRILEAIAGAWRDQRAQVEASAAQVTAELHRQLVAVPASKPETGTAAAMAAQVRERLFARLEAGFDAEHGGFGGAPKFPRPAALAFLLRHAAPPRAQHAGTRMVLATLAAMARGGIHDHIAGGFHRYAVDAEWRVPHFEKMLYDQAQLAVAYLEAWQISPPGDVREELAATARGTLEYVLAELRSPPGGFYSAQDADSAVPPEHRREGGASEGEGAYYLWTPEDLAPVLQAVDADAAVLFAFCYGVTAEGNVAPHLDAQGEFAGRCILYRAASTTEAARRFGRSPEEVERVLAAARTRLYSRRRQRPRPPCDDKIITAWNGLMISALAQAGAAWEVDAYVEAARAAAHFLEHELWDGQRLYRRWHGGQRDVAGFSSDYSFLIQGLLDLYQADFDHHWLTWAEQLQARLDADFAAPAGGYCDAAASADLWLRLREEYDGAEPSPNSVEALNLLRLAALQPERDWAMQAEALLESFATPLERAPEGLPLMACAAIELAAGPRSVEIRGPRPAATAWAAAVRRRFLPGWVLHWHEAEPPASAALCRDHLCEWPVDSLDAWEAKLAASIFP